MDQSQYGEAFDTWTKSSQYQQRVVDNLENYFKERPSFTNRIRSVMSIGAGKEMVPDKIRFKVD